MSLVNEFMTPPERTDVCASHHSEERQRRVNFEGKFMPTRRSFGRRQDPA